MTHRQFRPSVIENLSRPDPLDDLLQVLPIGAWMSRAAKTVGGRPWAERLSRAKNRIRTRTILQMEAAECGAAALAIVFSHFGLYLPLEQLREECGVSRDGTNAARLLSVARQYGFETSAFRKEPEDLTEFSHPVIIHWNFDHFVVLEGISPTKAWINDPARGRRTVSREEFDRTFTGPVLVLVPGSEFSPRGSAPRVIPILLEWLKGSRASVALLAMLGLLLVVPGIIVPALSKSFVDKVLTRHQSDLLALLLFGMAFTAVCRAALTWIHRDLLSRLSFQLVKTLSSNYLWHAMRLPLSFYLARHPGDVAARVEISDRLSWLLSGDLPSVALSALMTVFYAALMLGLDSRLAVIVLALAASSVIIDRTGARLRAEKASQSTLEQARWMSLSITGLQTIETLKANGIESRFFERWSGQQARLARAQQSLSLLSELLAAPTRFLHMIATILVLAIGARQVMSGQMTIGTLVAFQSLMASFLGPIGELTGFAGQIDLIRAQIARFRDVLDHPIDRLAAESRDATTLVRNLKGKVEFKNVTFGYNPLRPPCVKDLSFVCEPGSRLAIVGRTGCGKSTAARLISGLLSPWCGEIAFDESPRERMSQRVLTSRIATVEQEIHLFEGTIFENLTLWDETIPLENVERALRDACLDRLIEKLPEGLHTRLTEGGRNFSGGERQRFEIARALVRDPAVLVLDEATSALDTETEQRLYERIRCRGCTCIVVAHRLSAVRDSEEILVFDDGRVVERGKHAELWSANGRYRQLIQSE